MYIEIEKSINQVVPDRTFQNIKKIKIRSTILSCISSPIK